MEQTGWTREAIFEVAESIGRTLELPREHGDLMWPVLVMGAVAALSEIGRQIAKGAGIAKPIGLPPPGRLPPPPASLFDR
jgi:hypothetical protein